MHYHHAPYRLSLIPTEQTFFFFLFEYYITRFSSDAQCRVSFLLVGLCFSFFIGGVMLSLLHYSYRSIRLCIIEA